MKAFVYILFSTKLNRYYIGSTELPPIERLQLHLSHNYGNKKFTAKADDWMLFFSFECQNNTIARKAENYIKKQKSKVFIESLKDNPSKKVEWILSKL